MVRSGPPDGRAQDSRSQMRKSSLVTTLALAAAPWPLLRPCLSPSFARFHRRATAKCAAYLAAYAATLIAIGVWRPWLLLPILAAAGLSSAYQANRSRADYGSSRGLPPGPLPLVPVEADTDRDFFSKHLARYGPVSKTAVSWMHRPVVCVGGLDRGATLLRNGDDRLEWLGMSFDPLIPAGFLRSMRPDDHRRYRRIFASAFSERVIAARTPFLEDTASSTLREWPSGSAFDPRPSLARYTLSSFACLFLGVRPETDEHALIEKLYLEPGPFYVMGGLDGRRGDELRAAADAMADLVRRQAASAVSGSRDASTPSSFLGEIVAADDHAVDDANVVLNLVFLLGTSSRDVTGLMHWLVKMLADNPAWIDKAAAEDGAGDLPRRIVSETLRLAQSEYIARRAVKQLDLDGFVVPEGWYVRVCVQEAHRDPGVFDDPETFDPDRFARRRYTRREYAPFGMLEHSCLGVSAAMRVAETFVRELCAGYDLRVVDDGPVETDGYHWRPSRRHRVSLTPRLPDQADAAAVTPPPAEIPSL
jgi:cytochrome P450